MDWSEHIQELACVLAWTQPDDFVLLLIRLQHISGDSPRSLELSQCTAVHSLTCVELTDAVKATRQSQSFTYYPCLITGTCTLVLLYSTAVVEC